MRAKGLGEWRFDAEHGCWCLEDVVYAPAAGASEFQRLSVFAPGAYLRGDGSIDPEGRSGPYEASTAPVVFENNAAGYMQMPNTHLGEERCNADEFLRRGMVYVTCGCRGRESRDERGKFTGKSPASLIDLKMALRFLRHHRSALPGDWDRIVSVGWSAGGAMSALLGLTGDHPRFEPWLREAGAFMDESDVVFAAQIYCPIIDLEHADLAYEWCFGADKTNEASFAGPAETMTPFKEALSRELARRYVDYVNALRLRHPRTGEALALNPDGRSGSFYNLLLDCLGDAATEYLARLSADEAQAYVANLSGEGWFTWDGARARVTNLDGYVLHHRRRMKPCTAFDKLSCDSGENQVFGSSELDFAHFSPDVTRAVEALRQNFPGEVERFEAELAAQADPTRPERVRLYNPLNFIGDGIGPGQAKHYRIRVGTGDADTSLSVSLTLALRLANTGYPADYALVWDQPHCRADHPAALANWIDAVCAGTT